MIKSSFTKFAASFVLAGVMSVSAFAASQKKKRVEFFRDFSVNGQVVKKGAYTVIVDEASNELSIVSGKETLAKTQYRTEQTDTAASRTEVRYTSQGSENILKSIRFDGDRTDFVIGEGIQSAKPQQ